MINAPYGTLLGKVGPYGEVVRVGTTRRLVADGTGVIYLRINDADRCLGDNAGALTVRVR